MIKESYCSYEVARLLKEKGFDWKCIAYYVDSKPNDIQYSMLFENNTIWEKRCCSAPTHQMALKWLREVHGIDITIKITNLVGKNRKYYCMIWDRKNNSYIIDLFKSYEETEEAALKACLKKLI